MMGALNNMVKNDEIKPIVDSLYKKAGFHGSIWGCVKLHDDGEYTIEFWNVYDADEDDIDDDVLSEELGILLSEDHWDDMIRLVEKYPNLVDLDVDIKF